MQKELRLTGSGGQGLILAGVILSEAALLDGMQTIQSQSYGPEARGGSSKAEVIIGDEPIDFVKVQRCDMLLCLTQAAYDKYGKEYAATLITDSSIDITYAEPKPKQTVKVPILETAANCLGKPMVANIVALGAINGLLGLVSKESLVSAVLSRVPKGTEELNRKALEFGYELVK